MKSGFVAAIACVAIAAAAGGPVAAPSCDAMPGFSQSGPSRLYEGDNLFEYMDGNSEGYFIYGFVRMRGVTCARGAEKALIDISEMQDAESAYGLFSSFRDVKAPGEQIGAGGQIVPRKAIFVKDKYFIEISAESEGDHSAFLRQAAKVIEARIAGAAVVPEAIAWFPTEGLTNGPPRLIPESVLGIGALKRGYVAQYGEAKAFILTESSPEAAREVLKKLLGRYPRVGEAEAGGDEAYEADDTYLGQICIVRKGRRLAGYAAPRSMDPVKRTAELLTRLPN